METLLMLLKSKFLKSHSVFIAELKVRFSSMINESSRALIKLFKSVSDSKSLSLFNSCNITYCCRSFLDKSLTPSIFFHSDASSPFSSSIFSPTNTSVFLDTIQFKAVDPAYYLTPFLQFERVPFFLCAIYADFNSIKRVNNILETLKVKTCKVVYALIPVKFFTAAARFSALFPHLFSE